MMTLGLLFCSLLYAGDEREINLKGKWLFEIGDNLEWSQPDFDDSKWDVIYVPARWEEQDYPGYDGYAWYRRWVYIPKNLKTEILFLTMGFIDDVDQVFVNGNMVGGKGNYPPRYKTAYAEFRRYYLPKEYIKFGEKNLIAVRVYDDEQAGGITGGDPGIYSVRGKHVPELDLGGFWKFKTGDNKAWIDPKLNDKNWDEIIVPGNWEHQGYPEYDGFAWYRKHFRWPDEFDDDDLVLLLGRIDDADQAYLNGERIGSTGPMPEEPYHGKFGDWYRDERAYKIPDGLINRRGDNVLVVRVFDAWYDGGIYDIPIGITSRDALEERRREKGEWNLGDFLIRILEE